MDPRVRSTRCLPWLALAALFVSCSAGSTPSGPLGPAPEDFAVLFVGNSLTYTNDLPGLLLGLLEKADRGPVHMESVSYPNFGLEDHWTEGLARRRLSEASWDVVILQQGPSATEGRPSLLEFSARFAEEIKAAGASPALYMVWPAHSRAFDFGGVSESYQRAADEVDGILFPAGEAWRAAWSRDPELPLYGPDGFHPSLLGSYLAALVMLDQLADLDLEALDPRISSRTGDQELDPDLAEALYAAAREANARFARTPSGS